MKNSYKLVSLFICAVLFCASTFPTLAKSKIAENEVNLPEEEGTYNVPGKPKLKVKVFVYHPKNAAKGGNGKGPKPKPLPTPSPSDLVCNLEDPDSTAVVNPVGWHLPSGQWTYNINSSSVPRNVNSSNIGTVVSNSFDVWEQTVAGQSIAFTEGAEATTNKAKYDEYNLVSWGRINSNAIALTYVWAFPDTGEVVQVDTIFNKRYDWSWAGGSTLCAYRDSYDAQNILTHEVGHWVGLNDEYSEGYVNNTMFGYGSLTEVKKNSLTTGDIAGVSLIYP